MRKSSIVLALAGIVLITLGVSCKSDKTNTNTANVNTAVVEPQTVNVSVTVNDGTTTKTYTVKAPVDSTVDAVMEQANTENALQYVTKESAGLGKFVESIGGVASDANASKYWSYSVNGTPATTGISDTTVQEGDVISWEYKGF